eukprot:scaffold79592_cov46-Prasinocladus_malaysianus.AAC.1
MSMHRYGVEVKSTGSENSELVSLSSKKYLPKAGGTKEASYSPPPTCTAGTTISAGPLMKAVMLSMPLTWSQPAPSLAWIRRVCTAPKGPKQAPDC